MLTKIMVIDTWILSQPELMSTDDEKCWFGMDVIFITEFGFLIQWNKVESALVRCKIICISFSSISLFIQYPYYPYWLREPYQWCNLVDIVFNKF